MKRLIIICGIAALAACSGADEGAQPAAHNQTVPTETGSDESVAGSYKVVRKDGSSFTSVINADGTYSEVVDGVTKVSGKWKSEGERTCYDPDGPDKSICYTFGEAEQPAEKGAFSAKAESGEVFTVRKIEK